MKRDVAIRSWQDRQRGFCLLALALHLACSLGRPSAPAQQAGQATPRSPTIRDALYWRSLRDLNALQAQGLAVGSEQREFASTLDAAMGGDPLQAEARLAVLAGTSGDPAIRLLSFCLRSRLLMGRGQWRELVQWSQRFAGGLAPLRFAEAFAQAAPEEYRFAESSSAIPLDDRSGLLMLAVEVNGRRQKFLLDTGSSLSVVASDVARQNRIRVLSGKSGSAGTATGLKVGFRPALIQDLRLGSLSIQNHPVMVISRRDMMFRLKLIHISRLERFDGILGWNALRHLRLEIDLKQKRLLFTRAGSAGSAERNLFGFDTPLVRLRTPEGRTLYFLLDTGANRTSLTEHILRKTSIRDPFFVSGRVFSVGGSEKIKLQIVPHVRLVLDEREMPFRDIRLFPELSLLGFFHLDGRLGSDLFSFGAVVLDGAAGRIELRPFPNVVNLNK